MLELGDVFWCDVCCQLLPRNDTWETTVRHWGKTIKAVKCPACRTIQAWVENVKETK